MTTGGPDLAALADQCQVLCACQAVSSMKMVVCLQGSRKQMIYAAWSLPAYLNAFVLSLE